MGVGVGVGVGGDTAATDQGSRLASAGTDGAGNTTGIATATATTATAATAGTGTGAAAATTGGGADGCLGDDAEEGLGGGGVAYLPVELHTDPRVPLTAVDVVPVRGSALCFWHGCHPAYVPAVTLCLFPRGRMLGGGGCAVPGSRRAWQPLAPHRATMVWPWVVLVTPGSVCNTQQLACCPTCRSTLHEGSLVTKGTKYVVRTDVLYARNPPQ